MNDEGKNHSAETRDRPEVQALMAELSEGLGPGEDIGNVELGDALDDLDRKTPIDRSPADVRSEHVSDARPVRGHHPTIDDLKVRISGKVDARRAATQPSMRRKQGGATAVAATQPAAGDEQSPWSQRGAESVPADSLPSSAAPKVSVETDDGQLEVPTTRPPLWLAIALVVAAGVVLVLLMRRLGGDGNVTPPPAAATPPAVESKPQTAAAEEPAEAAAESEAQPTGEGEASDGAKPEKSATGNGSAGDSKPSSKKAASSPNAPTPNQPKTTSRAKAPAKPASEPASKKEEPKPFIPGAKPAF